VTLIGASSLLLARGGEHDWHTGDTSALVKGLPGIARCLDAHVLAGCNNHLLVEVSSFPLIQMVPAYLFHLSGQSANSIENALAWLNAVVTVLFCAMVLRWCYRRCGTPLAVVGGLLLIPGMLVAYTAQTFGEPLAVAAFGGACIAALRTDRMSPWLVPLTFAATISKDTAAPFVILIVLAGMARSGCTRQIARHTFGGLALGVALGLAATAAFNVFRYGSMTNSVYLEYPIASVGMAGNVIIGLLVSPNGGISWFWPGTVIAMTVLGVTLARGRWYWRDQGGIRAASALGLMAIGGSVLVLAFWWQPFGWYAWGPRLLMPIAPAIIVLALSVLSQRQVTRYWLSPAGATALALMATFAMAPSIGVVFNWHAYTAQVLSVWKYHPECQSHGGSPSQSAMEQCLRFQAWETTDMNLVRAVPGALSGHWWYWGTVTSATASIFLWAGVGCSVSRRRSEDSFQVTALPETLKPRPTAASVNEDDARTAPSPESTPLPPRPAR
jgi:hypothetical protein